MLSNWGNKRGLDNVTDTHKLETLKKYIRTLRDDQAHGWEIPRIPIPGQETTYEQVERFLQHYFEASHLQRFRDKNVIALEEFVKEMLLQQTDDEIHTESLRWELTQLSQDIFGFLAERKTTEPVPLSSPRLLPQLESKGFC